MGEPQTRPVMTRRGICWPAPYLGVHGWVPVRIVKDDRVGASEVDAQTTAARGENEAEDPVVAIEPGRRNRAVRGMLSARFQNMAPPTQSAIGHERLCPRSAPIAPVHQPLAVHHVGGAIEAKVGHAVVGQKQLQDVEHARHLRKNEHAVLALLHFAEHLLQHLQLAAVVLVGCDGWGGMRGKRKRKRKNGKKNKTNEAKEPGQKAARSNEAPTSLTWMRPRSGNASNFWSSAVWHSARAP